MNKICVYAICKNESKFVDRWCNSMSEADCIVVLDTGSTDDTVEKLRSHGVTVVQKAIEPWRFDVARNESLKLVPSDCNILVCTDLDEYFDKGWAKYLRERWIEGVHKRCHYSYYYANLDTGFPEQIITYNKIHGRGWHWRCPVHELMVKDSDGNEDLSEYEILYLVDEIMLRHTPDIKKSRSNYLDLLEIRRKENPTDYFGLYYMALDYEHDYHNYQKAIEVLEDALKVCDDGYYTFMITGKIGMLQKKNGNNEVALVYLKKAISSCDEYRFLILESADILFYYYKDYNGAYNMLLHGLKSTFQHDYWYEQPYGWGSEYYDLLSLSAFYCGKTVESLIYALIAQNKDKNNERYKNNIEIIKNSITEIDIKNYEE